MAGFLGFGALSSGAISAPPTPASPITAVTGTLAEQLDAVTISASGAVDTSGVFTGTINSTLDGVTLDASGTLGAVLNITGTLSATLVSSTATGAGTVAAPSNVTGSLSQVIDSVRATATGAVDVGAIVSGSAAATLDSLRASAFGTIGEVTAGDITVTLDDLAISATGINVTAPSGTLSATFSDVVATGAGFSSSGIGLGWELATQKALYDKLKSNAYLASLVTDIYDNPPEETSAYPYVTIGEAVHNEFDTDTDEGNDVTVSVHVWSRDRGRKEVKEIQNAIYLALSRQELSVIGYNFINCQFVTSQSFLDSDGKTRHGVQDFQILLDELEEG